MSLDSPDLQGLKRPFSLVKYNFNKKQFPLSFRLLWLHVMELDITCPQAAHASNCILKWRPWYMGSLVIQASTTV